MTETRAATPALTSVLLPLSEEVRDEFAGEGLFDRDESIAIQPDWSRWTRG